MSDWSGTERRKHPREQCKPDECPYWNDDEISRIAERAASVALERVYADIGKSVVTKFLWVCGAISLAVFAWLNGKGLLSP